MNTKLSVSLLLAGIILLITLGPAVANAKTAFFKYSQDPGETISLWLSNHQLKIELSGGDRSQVLLFDADTTPANLYLTHGQEGVKITEPALRRVVAHLNIRYEQMQKNMQETLGNLPEDKKQQLKESMPSFEEINIDSAPQVQFKAEQDTTWRGRSAIKGHFLVDNNPRAEAILFKSPPLELTDGQKNTLRAFQNLLASWIEIVSRQPKFTGGENPFRDTQNLVGKFYPRLAQLREDDKLLVLDQWQQINEPDETFQTPKNKSIRSIDLDLFKSSPER